MTSKRFCALCIEFHRGQVLVTGLETREEVQWCGFDSYTALKLGLQFERYRQLLDNLALSGHKGPNSYDFGGEPAL